ncbi:hypothetical protein, partial [Mycolicibacter minnesotensis]|uniref:hypothetical protein n=1 Tax=Mycolicibacter minnesotensis TaxID=1118379 RepID=UPI0021F2E95C
MGFTASGAGAVGALRADVPDAGVCGCGAAHATATMAMAAPTPTSAQRRITQRRDPMKSMPMTLVDPGVGVIQAVGRS